MGRVETLLIAAAATVLSACAHYGSAAGDVAIAPDIAANTTVLRVVNQYTADMRIYTVLGGKEHYLGSVPARTTRDFAMNPELIGESGISFSARESSGDESTAVSRGPYLIDRGRLVEFAITKHDVDDMKRTYIPPGR